MNAQLNPPEPARTPDSRFDAKFIDDHRLLERYLDNKLPVKGAREFEAWCREHADYLEGIRLPERTSASLRLLEASGRPVDLSEPATPWWRSAYVAPALGFSTFALLLAFWAVFAKYDLVRSELNDAHVKLRQGSLEQPATASALSIAPDRAPGVDKAIIAITQSKPQLIDLHVDMNYTKATQFRVVVDKKDQGRAIVISNIQKDSNGELRLLFNTSGLSAGIYTVRIEGLPFHGSPIPEGWLMLDVR